MFNRKFYCTYYLQAKVQNLKHVHENIFTSHLKKKSINRPTNSDNFWYANSVGCYSGTVQTSGIDSML